MDGSTSLITAPIFAGFVGGASQRVTMGYPTKVDGWIANVSNNHNIVLVYRYKILTRNHALWRLFYARLILHPPKKQFIYFWDGNTQWRYIPSCGPMQIRSIQELRSAIKITITAKEESARSTRRNSSDEGALPVHSPFFGSKIWQYEPFYAVLGSTGGSNFI